MNTMHPSGWLVGRDSEFPKKTRKKKKKEKERRRKKVAKADKKSHWSQARTVTHGIRGSTKLNDKGPTSSSLGHNRKQYQRKISMLSLDYK
jgi:hypothetical protein